MSSGSSCNVEPAFDVSPEERCAQWIKRSREIVASASNSVAGMSEASNRRWLAWLLKSKFPSPRDEEHGVARFTVLEIWLSFYVMPSLERCSEILLRIKKMNLLIAVKVSLIC